MNGRSEMEPIHAATMGEFGEDGPVMEGTCRVCGAPLVNPTSRYCLEHRNLYAKARKQARRLAELSLQRKREQGHQLVHDWWTKTE